MEMMCIKNGRGLVVSPFSLDDDLLFHADYFLEDMVMDTPHTTIRLEQKHQRIPIDNLMIGNMYKNSPILMSELGSSGQKAMMMNAQTSHHHVVKQQMMNNGMIGLQQQMLNGSPKSSAVLEDYEKLARTFQNLYSNNNGSVNGLSLSSNGGVVMSDDDQSENKKQFKLPSSKSPIMEALVYCSINKFGIELKELNNNTQKISFLVSDFNTYYKHSCSICSKQSPSEDIRARMKALQRWFTSFPAWRELEKPFELVVRQSHYMKMHEIITKMVRFYSETTEI